MRTCPRRGKVQFLKQAGTGSEVAVARGWGEMPWLCQSHTSCWKKRQHFPPLPISVLSLVPSRTVLLLVHTGFCILSGSETDLTNLPRLAINHKKNQEIICLISKPSGLRGRPHRCERDGEERSEPGEKKEGSRSVLFPSSTPRTPGPYSLWQANGGKQTESK